MSLKSDKQVLLSELGSTIKKLILDNRDNSEDFKEALGKYVTGSLSFFVGFDSFVEFEKKRQKDD